MVSSRLVDPPRTADGDPGCMNTSRLSIARALVAYYVALSLLALAVLGILSAVAPGQAGAAAWVRGSIVAATGILMFVFATQAVRGSGQGLLRWRIVVIVMVVAIAVVISIPGLLPLWFVLEQIVCGLLLLAVAALILSRRATAAVAAVASSRAGE
jgi:predicted Na+-dependent transporter